MLEVSCFLGRRGRERQTEGQAGPGEILAVALVRLYQAPVGD